jgi:hypothetical protein
METVCGFLKVMVFLIWKDMLGILWARDLSSQVRKAIKNKGVCYPLRINYLGLNPFVRKEISLLPKIKGPLIYKRGGSVYQGFFEE